MTYLSQQVFYTFPVCPAGVDLGLLQKTNDISLLLLPTYLGSQTFLPWHLQNKIQELHPSCLYVLFIFNIFGFILCVIAEHTCHAAGVEVREQHCAAGSLPPPSVGSGNGTRAISTVILLRVLLARVDRGTH